MLKKTTIIALFATIPILVSFKNLYFYNELSQFNYKIFIILIVTSFLFLYKILQYIANFKIRKHGSLIDIIFLSVFFLILIIPISKIDTSEKSIRENRMLAKYTPLLSEYKVNNDFGKNFENWFNDRFRKRKSVVKRYTKLKNRINNKKCLHTDKEKFLCLVKNNTFIDARRDFGMLSSEHKTFDNAARSMQEYVDFCKNNNIKLYINIVPRKLDFYLDDMQYIPLSESEKIDNAKLLTEYLKNNLSVPVLFFDNEMKNANKKELVYFKSDHHWTPWGAYIAYSEVIKSMQKDYPALKLVNLDDYDTYLETRNIQYSWDKIDNYHGSAIAQLGLGKSFALSKLKYKYPIYVNRNEKFLSHSKKIIKEDGPFVDEEFIYKDGYNKRLLIIGDSMNQQSLRYFPYSFKYVKRMDANPRENLLLNQYKEGIEAFKPDIILIQFMSSLGNYFNQ